MKKIISLFLSLTVIMTLMLSISFEAFADTDFSKAVAVNVNTDISGNVNEGANKEKDIYKVTVNSNGAFTINLKTPLQKDAGKYWKIYLYDGEFNKITEKAVTGNKTSTDTVRTGVARGTYYVIVCSSDNYSAESKDKYSLNIGFVSSDYWEKELNEGFSTASYLELNQNYYGSTDDGGNYENDYYSFYLPTSEVVKISFVVPLQANSNSYWRIYLYDGEYNEIMKYNIRGSVSNNLLPETGLGAGTYYLKINSADSYSVSSTDVYTLCIDATVSDFWEKELNEDYASSSYMNLNADYFGTTHNGANYEKDFYRFNIAKTGSYDIIFKTPKMNSANTVWRAYLYDENYQYITRVEIKGNTTRNSINNTLSAGSYYIRFESYDSYNPSSTAVYSLGVYEHKKTVVNIKGKTASVKYANLKKKNQTINKSKAFDTSKLQTTVTYSKISGNSKISVNKNTGNITVKKGLKKGTYKVNVKVKPKSSNYLSKTVTVTIKVK